MVNTAKHTRDNHREELERWFPQSFKSDSASIWRGNGDLIWLVLGPMTIKDVNVIYYTAIYGFYVVIQQFILLGFIYERLRCLFYEQSHAAVVLATLAFSAGHFPNPTLMLATLTGGPLFIYIFRKSHSVLPSSFLHAILGIMVFKAFQHMTPNFAIGWFYFY